MSGTSTGTRSILLVGASRGLGLGIAGEFSARGWRVTGTVRDGARTGLHELSDGLPDLVEIETVDISSLEEVAAMRDRLAGRSYDVLFVNAGTADMSDAPAGGISNDEYARVMVTNALGPTRVIEACGDLVSADGLIGVMSSGQGSIANNHNGLHEVYRSSKAALNQHVRSFAARQADARRSIVLMAPGWIRTRLGGERAPFGIEESVPLLVDVLLERVGRPGLAYVDRNGDPVPW